VLWIRIGFNADPDPAFYIITDPDPGSQTNVGPCGSGAGTWSDFAVTKIWIFTRVVDQDRICICIADPDPGALELTKI
jgi:hypothetical protein